jgi:hypothetical protein
MCVFCFYIQKIKEPHMVMHTLALTESKFSLLQTPLTILLRTRVVCN